MTRKDGGVELSWNRGALQVARSINGPWQDYPVFGNPRRVFLRTPFTAEFFRVKPD